MSKSKKKKKKSGMIIFLILFFTFPFILGVTLIIYNHIYMSKAESTEAVITSVEKKMILSGRRRRLPQLVFGIRYYVDGVAYNDTYIDKVKNAANTNVGDVITVYYLPGKPQKTTTGYNLISAGRILIVWGFIQPVFIFALGFLSVKKKREKREKNEQKRT